MKSTDSRLASPAATVYTLLVVYASLHPLVGWRATGVDLFDFLYAPWPRYYTAFDMATNVLAYALLGFLWDVALHARMRQAWAVVLTCAFGFCLSLSMETLQNFLPTRVASNVDLLCNSLGALGGALAAIRWGGVLRDDGRLATWWRAYSTATRRGDHALLLCGVWLLTSIDPENFLFGAGALRHLFDIPPPLPFAAPAFTRIEALIALFGALAVGLTFSLVPRRAVWSRICALFAAALLIKTLAFALIRSPLESLHWLTGGNAFGFALALMLLLPLMRVPAEWRRALALLALLALCFLINVAPDNPYLQQAAHEWRLGQWLNIIGVARFASVVWPFAALFVLVLPQRRYGN